MAANFSTTQNFLQPSTGNTAAALNNIVGGLSVSGVGSGAAEIAAAIIETGTTVGGVTGSAGAGSPALRKLGTGANDAAAGNDTRFVNTITPVYNVVSYGAKGDGVTDDTTAIQAAVTASTGMVFFPPGVYLTDQITIAKSLVIFGAGSRFEAGATGTRFFPKTNVSSVFYVNCQGPVVFRDFSMGGNPQTAGYGIQIDYTAASAVANIFTLIDNVVFDAMFTCIYSKAASSWSVRNCVFWNIPASGTGIIIDNTFNKDQGDTNVSGCTFAPAAFGNTGIGITWLGGSGARIENNKFFMSDALNFNVSAGTATGQLYVVGNSFDNTLSAINVFQSGGTAVYGAINIIGNQLFGYNTTVCFITITGIAGAHITDVQIVGNQIQQVGGTVSGSGGIKLDYVDRFLITGNYINGIGTANGIAITANCTNGGIDANEVQNWTNLVVVNASATKVRYRGQSNSGAQAATDGGSYPHGLLVTPRMVRASNSIAAEFVNITAIDATNFTVAIKKKDGTAGTNQNIYWEAEE